MPSRTQVQVIIGIAVVVWGVALFLAGVSLKPSYLKPFSYAVSIALLLLLAFDQWLWRIPFIAHLLHRPVLRGTWKGELQSSWVDQPNGKVIDPIPVYLGIRQTYSTISLSLMTKESSSHSLVASLDSPRNGVPRVISTYQNIPDLLIQYRSRVHYGALLLEVHGNPHRVVGSYWTDRDTKGQVVLTNRTPKHFTDYEGARQSGL
jgi:SMODS-associating 2TM, beta-strand rich effector domain